MSTVTPRTRASALPAGAALTLVGLSILVHLVLLWLLTWPVRPLPVKDATVRLELVPPPAMPVEPAPAEHAATPAVSTSALLDAQAPVPVDLSALPLPEVVGPPRSGGGGVAIASTVSSASTPMISIAGLDVPARRVVFLLDVSSSMGGAFGSRTLGDVAADALCRALAGLPDTGQFRVLLMSSGIAQPMGEQWRWASDAPSACDMARRAMAAPSGLTRTAPLFEDGHLHDMGAEAVVLLTDGGVLDLEAGGMQRWLESAPGVRFDVVMVGPVTTLSDAQRRLGVLARRTGGGLHRIYGSVQP